jgi:NAD(P)H-flavin reductase
MATAVAESEHLTHGAMTPLPYRVVRRRRETVGVYTLELEPVDDAISPVAPGQFTMLYAFGVGEAPISVSRCGDTLTHTIREAGAVTQALCASRAGDLVGVRGPFGNTWPVAQAQGKDVVLIAGGIGLPPLRPVIYHLLAHRRDYGKVVILYGGRSPADLLYRAELEKWRARLDVTLDVTVDTAGPEWHGRVGVVTKLIPRAPFDPENAVAMIVGPEIMMRFSAEALIERGLPAEQIWISMERTMRCGVGLCGHCQLGPTLVCRDGAVYRWPDLEALLGVPEL